MHRALRIQEIASLIANEVEAYPDLASLARTCRILSEPALDALWSILPSLVPLLTVFPADLVKRKSYRDCQHPTYIYDFRRPLTLADWTMLKKFSRRVVAIQPDLSAEELHYDDGNRTWLIVSEKALRALSSPLTPDPVFPKLQHLEWQSPEPRSFSILRTLAGPSLKVLDLGSMENGFNNFDGVWPRARVWNDLTLQERVKSIEVIGELGERSPLMNVFKWMHDCDPNELRPLVSRSIKAWNYLTLLDVPPLDADALAHIALTPHLEEIWLNLPIGSAVTPDIGLQGAIFPNLWNFSLNGVFSESADFLDALGGTMSSTNIYFCTYEVGGASDLSKLFASVSRHFSPDKADSLTVVEDFGGSQVKMDAQSGPGFEMTISSLRPALRLHRIEKVYIDLNRTVVLGDNDIIELANAWPKLEELVFNVNRGFVVPSQITLKGLFELLKRLPGLKTLGLEIDARSGTGSGTIPAEPLRHSLRSWNMLDSIVGDNVAEVAEHVRRLVWYGGFRVKARKFGKQWGQVFGILGYQLSEGLF
ncbi:hypothetical protein CONPUDRAFT_144914 [Coniophora puteana RWD-64-598 SS2]|uniref:F-box domain-containing protein n=1 Tax=Coniophora puteana (strain RWD-64-598) TaxID=741705 RepID=A0A5M3MKI0_CONPW|nr:uncharacterized protein CONPUDRAFT_144914 [Coniophora puteana RWD-64-598 SS2]EIW79738.1 hypothetical protein CONPUDRAFT_144914 [Coniophora puteana RWD-64-598 SS2]